MTHPDAILRALARIRAENGATGAFTHVAPDPERGALEAVVGRPLRGLPLAVKDLVDTADMPTRYGSAIYDAHQPSMDAAIVAALRIAGAFIVGKTATTEFATHPPTAVRNPRNEAHTPGGSSAGSAAAVAAGLVPAALGTQTLGSIIRPASYCGVVGFKPSHGWFSLAGVKELAASLDTLGFFASDVAVMRSIYAALVPDDVPVASSRPRLLFSRAPNWHLATQDARAAIEHCIGKLRDKAFAIAETPMPDGFNAIADVADVIHDYEMRRALAPEIRVGRDRMDRTLAARIEQAGRWSTADYRAALAAAEAQRSTFADLYQAFDAILCLSAAGEAPRGLASTGTPIMNSAWTALHLPCLSLPVMSGTTGLPIGLQVIAGKHQNFKLLNIAAQIEAAIPTPLKYPTPYFVR